MPRTTETILEIQILRVRVVGISGISELLKLHSGYCVGNKCKGGQSGCMEMTNT